MKQCLECANRCYFEPYPYDVYHCCSAWGETAKDIDLKTGVSPKISEHGVKNVPCWQHKPGKSICCIPDDHPFFVPVIRQEGEEYIRNTMESS